MNDEIDLLLKFCSIMKLKKQNKIIIRSHEVRSIRSIRFDELGKLRVLEN